MRQKSTAIRKAQGLVIAGLMLFSGVDKTSATIITKANSNNALNDTSSWTPGTVPNMTNIARWNSTLTAPYTTAALGADLTWRGIIFSDPASSFTITGANTLTLGSNGINMTDATQNLTISSNLRLLTSSYQIWNVASGRTLALNTGTFTRSAGSSLNIQGDGTVTATSLTNNPTGIVGAWMTYGSGANTFYATMTAGAVTNYAAGTAAATADLITDTTGNVNYNLAGLGAIGAGASFNTLRYTGGTGTVTGNFSANGLLNSGAGNNAVTFSGDLTIGASKDLVIHSPDANRQIILTGAVSDHASGSSSITKSGDGTITLGGANTYTGLTHISRGYVNVTSNDALGSTLRGTMIYSGDNSANATANPPSTQMPGGTLNLSGDLTINESLVFMYGSGNPVLSLQISGASTSTGKLFVTGNTPFTTSGGGIRWNITSSTAPVKSFTITGGIVSNSQVVFNGDTNASYIFRNTALNLGSGSFYADQAAVNIIIETSGNMWGDTVATANVRTDAANALPNTTSVRIGLSYQGGGTLNLNGNNQTIGEIRTDSFVRTASRVITSATAATLTINQTNNTTLDAQLTGAVSIVKNGTGTLTLGGVSTTTGTITINKGTIVESFNYATASAGSSGSATVSNLLPTAAPLIMGGGTFQVQGRANGTATSLAGASWTNGTSTITVTSTAGLVPGQPISSAMPGLPAGAYVVTVLNGSQFLINANTTAASTASTTITTVATTYNTSQTFSSVTLNAGGSNISVNANGGNGTVLNLGNITRNAGGTVNFTLPAGTQSNTNGITTNQTNTNGILGGWATVGNNWAVNATNAANGNIVALTSAGYTDVTRLESGSKTIANNPAANVRIIDGTGVTAASITPAASGTTTINSLLQTATGAVTYDPGTTDILRLGVEGGIMIASDTNTGALNIGTAANDGFLTAGGTDNTAGAIYLTNQHATALLTINSAIIDNGTGVVSLVKAGPGTAVLTGTNTYTGKTYIGAGKLSISSEAALGSASVGGADHLTLAGGTLLTTASFSIDDANRGILLAPAGGTFETNSGTTLTVANVISGTGDLIKTGSGTLSLTAANTHSGETIVSAGTLSLGNVNALQNSTLAGAVSLAVSGTNTYNIGGLRGSGGINLGSNTIVVGSNNIATVYAGVLSGAGNFTKTGTAVLNLTNASTHSGTTLLQNGYLGIYNVNALQNSTLDTGASSTTKEVQFQPNMGTFNFGGLRGSDDIDINVNSISVGSNNADTVFSGAIISAFDGNVTKVGTGKLTFAGANTYTGNTNVNVGILHVGQAGVGQTGYGAVSVASNAQIIGTGTIQGSSFTLASNATIRPGDSVAASSHGRLTFTPIGAGTYNFQAGSKTVLSLSTPGLQDGTFGNNEIGTQGYFDFLAGVMTAGNHDQLVFNGSEGSTLQFNGDLSVVSSGFTARGGEIFKLLNWSDVVSASFANIYSTSGIQNGLSDNDSQFDLPDLDTANTGLYWDTRMFASHGVLSVIPEPSRGVLFMIGFSTILLQRRRRKMVA